MMSDLHDGAYWGCVIPLRRQEQPTQYTRPGPTPEGTFVYASQAMGVLSSRRAARNCATYRHIAYPALAPMRGSRMPSLWLA